MENFYDVIIVGSGPAGLGVAFELCKNEITKNKKILLIDKELVSSGGLRNDCKQNYTYPIGFSAEYWKDEAEANECLEEVKKILKPEIQNKTNLEKYKQRAKKLNVNLLEIEQAHVGTDESVVLINKLVSQLRELGVTVELNCEMIDLDENKKEIKIKNTEEKTIAYGKLVLALGRKGAILLQNLMNRLNIKYVDNIVDIGIRVETKIENYEIVKDYYDPKFYFPNNVRTFCTNSGAAYVVQEKYDSYFSVNGHALSDKKEANGLVNFAILKTIKLTDPVASGVYFARILGETAMQLSGGKPMMQRIGDFRMGKRSKKETFNLDLYDFEPTLASSTPGDIGLAMPSRILRDIWKSMKMLDTIVPGILRPETIMYYPEIKTYGNKPEFLNEFFEVKDSIYMIGDGAGTSRGITGAWASGIRCARGIMESAR